MMRRRLIIGISLLLLFIGSECNATTTITAERMAADAVMFLPETLRYVVTLYWEDIQSSLRNSSIKKSQKLHHYYWHSDSNDGLAPSTIAKEVCLSTKLIRRKKPFSKVFSRFGNIAFLVAESFNPLNTDNHDPDEIYYYTAFEQYVENCSPKFRIRFQGYTILPVDEKVIEQDIERRLNKLNNFYLPLSTEYKKRFSEGRPFNFGYQSIPFGIAMISYSHAVTAIVDLWCSIWKGAGGELNNQPFDIGK